jgi:hypothetical protein
MAAYKSTEPATQLRPARYAVRSGPAERHSALISFIKHLSRRRSVPRFHISVCALVSTLAAFDLDFYSSRLAKFKNRLLTWPSRGLSTLDLDALHCTDYAAQRV